MTEVDVAIIGAGAAGIGAARVLHGSGRSVLLLEASQRAGGRAHSVAHASGMLDLGCGWLHSADRNPWVAIAEATGHEIDRSPPAWGKQYRELGFPREDQDAAGAAFAAFDERLRTAPPASDRASDALDPACPWNGFIEAMSGYINGVGLQRLSIADYLAYDDAASDANWRLPGGYGQLIASALPPVPIALATPVTRIETEGKRLLLATRHGKVAAHTAIVTVSTAVLTAGLLALPSALNDHLDAAANLPLGLADKLFLAIDDGAMVDADAHLLGDPRSGVTGSYYLRPMGMPVVECFLGGEGACARERDGLDGAAAFAREELRRLLGSRFAERLRLVAGSAWGADRWTRGSYSHALPGRRAARQRLAAPHQQRLFFAGEACSGTDFSTAHGALATGMAAAHAALDALAG